MAFYKFVDMAEEVRRVLGGNPERVIHEYKADTYCRNGKMVKVDRLFHFDDDTSLGNIWTVEA